MKKQTDQNAERTTWLVLFSYGDSRTTNYGWAACPKDEYTKKQASSQGKSLAKRKGEREFGYFVTDIPYVTDSIEAFRKACTKVNVRPNLSDYE